MHERDRKEATYLIDLFHTISLGVGKTFAASSAVVLHDLCAGSSIDERLRNLSSQFIEFCKDSHGTWDSTFSPTMVNSDHPC